MGPGVTSGPTLTAGPGRAGPGVTSAHALTCHWCVVTGQTMGAGGLSLNNKHRGWEREGEEFFMLCQQPEQRLHKDWAEVTGGEKCNCRPFCGALIKICLRFLLANKLKR